MKTKYTPKCNGRILKKANRSIISFWDLSDAALDLHSIACDVHEMFISCEKGNTSLLYGIDTKMCAYAIQMEINRYVRI